jgi:basic membrane protein A
MSKFAAAASAITLALALTACGSEDGSGGDGTDGGEGDSDITIGLAYDVGGRGDQSFNDSAAAGADQAVEEFGFKLEEAEATDGEAESAREERLRTFADAGVDPIIAVGFAYAPSVAKVAPEYPDIHFALIDSPTRRARTSPTCCSPRSRDRSSSERQRRWSPRPATSASSVASTRR